MNADPPSSIEHATLQAQAPPTRRCDEWIAGDRRYLSEESMALLAEPVDTGDHAAIESGE